MSSCILVVDDDPDLAEMLGIILEAEGYRPVFCGDGAQALTVFQQLKPDLVLLDVMLPGLSGIEVCRQLRAESGVPIVMLTAKSDTGEVVAGLESGADDYVVKPFQPKELLARLKVRLRGASQGRTDRLRVGDVEIDVAGHVVSRAGAAISLTPLEFELLVALASKPWQVFTRQVLLEEVWGHRFAGDTRLVNVHVQRLRAKVELDVEHPQIVVTVRGVGYRAGGAEPAPAELG